MGSTPGLRPPTGGYVGPGLVGPSRDGEKSQLGSMELKSTVGQFSFGPAIQTTVVTTKTTTTTQFPPFLMRPPRRLHDLSTKQYPLSAVPTPAALRNISFVLNGEPTTFHEADDATFAIRELQEEHQSLENANGTIRSIQTFAPELNCDISRSSNPSTVFRSRSRPVSPESVTETEDTVGHDRKGSSSASVAARRKETRGQGPNSLGKQSRLSSLFGVHPVTPATADTRQRRLKRRVSEELSTEAGQNGAEETLPSPRTEQLRPRVTTSHIRPLSRLQHQIGHTTPEQSGQPAGSDGLVPISAHSQPNCSVPTPPTDPADRQLDGRPPSRRNIPSVPTRLNVVDHSTGQDGSLPSPSLSPITAASALQTAGYFADVDSNSDFASQYEQDMYENDANLAETPSRSRFASPASGQLVLKGGLLESGSRFSGTLGNDIPAMLDVFETIPDEMKSYIMHQLLRRCSKPTLQIVADAVNPALKCDFLGDERMAAELKLKILKFLDLRSLCRAAQVSKKWRLIINGAEQVWKDLLELDGFILPDGELKRAILEGWCWQESNGFNDHEEDWSQLGGARSDSESMSSDMPSSQTAQKKVKSQSSGVRRSKRKAERELPNRRKQPRRKDRGRERAADTDSADWMAQLIKASGPNEAAAAAENAVLNPKLPFPALKSRHLYKSLYRRNFLIHRNWMHEDTKPHHIAFRAHDRHVVTCLQFDTDKILTGSDDNNINVYDTKTGALRVRLEGHEGGVWALQYDGNTLVSGSTDRSVRVWDIERGTETQVFRGHTSTVRCLQIVAPVKIGEMADGKAIMAPKRPLIITGSRDSTLRIWHLPQPGDKEYFQAEIVDEDEPNLCPYFVRTLSGHAHSVRAIAAYADTLVSGSYDSSVRVWKISTGETVHRLQGHSAKVYSVVLDNGRNRCISGSMDNLVKIWSLDTGSALYTLEGHTSLVGLLDLNYERLVSAAADSTLRIWDPENGQCKTTLSAHTGAITCFQHDSQKVLSGSDRTLKMWNVKTGEVVKDLLNDLSGVWQVKFNERRCVAAVQRDGITYIEVLDFGAARDGVPDTQRGRRIVVDEEGLVMVPLPDAAGYLDPDRNARN